jgi:hypothetical protein
MENRAAYRGTGISKGIAVLFALLVAISLGVMAAFAVKAISGPAAATPSELVSSTYSGPGPDAQERNAQRHANDFADDKASTGHGQLP